jgi:hypothetical protein
VTDDAARRYTYRICCVVSGEKLHVIEAKLYSSPESESGALQVINALYRAVQLESHRIQVGHSMWTHLKLHC